MIYLKKFIPHFYGTMDARYNTTSSWWHCGGSDCYYNGSFHEMYASTDENGPILRALADFAYLILVEQPSLSSQPIPTFPEIYTPSFTTYGDLAEYCYAKAKETILAFDCEYCYPIWMDYWDPSVQLYRKGLQHNDHIAELNFQTQMGLANLYMYLVHQDAYFLNKVIPVVLYIKNYYNLYQPAYNRGWVYNSVNDSWMFMHSEDYVEDINHLVPTADFILQVYRHLPGHFSSTDLSRISNTIMRNCYAQPTMLRKSIVPGSDDCYICPGGEYNTTPDALLRLLPICQWYSASDLCLNDATGHDMFQAAVEIAYEQLKIMDPYQPPSYSAIGGSFLLGLANICFYSSNDYYHALRLTGKSDFGHYADHWCGLDMVRSGGSPFLVGLRNYNSSIYIFDEEAVSGGVDVIAHDNVQVTPGVISSSWADVAAGDLNGDGDDELVAVSNSNNHFYAWDHSGGSWHQIASKALTGTAVSDHWSALEVADLDGDGIEEIIAVREVDNRFFVLHYDNSVGFSSVWQGYFTGTSVPDEWAGLIAGDFDGDHIIELRGYRNNGGDLFEWEYHHGELQFQGMVSPNNLCDLADLAVIDWSSNGRDEMVTLGKDDGSVRFFDGPLASMSEIDRDDFVAHDRWNSIVAGPVACKDDKSLAITRNVDGGVMVFNKARQRACKRSRTGLKMDFIQDATATPTSVNEWTIPNTLTGITCYDAMGRAVWQGGTFEMLQHYLSEMRMTGLLMVTGTVEDRPQSYKLCIIGH